MFELSIGPPRLRAIMYTASCQVQRFMFVYKYSIACWLCAPRVREVKGLHVVLGRAVGLTQHSVIDGAYTGFKTQVTHNTRHNPMWTGHRGGPSTDAFAVHENVYDRPGTSLHLQFVIRRRVHLGHIPTRAVNEMYLHTRAHACTRTTVHRRSGHLRWWCGWTTNPLYRSLTITVTFLSNTATQHTAGCIPCV